MVKIKYVQPVTSDLEDKRLVPPSMRGPVNPLFHRVESVEEAYRSAVTPKEKWKAMSELCRLADRLGTSFPVVEGRKVYLTSCVREDEYRLPSLEYDTEFSVSPDVFAKR